MRSALFAGGWPSSKRAPRDGSPSCRGGRSSPPLSPTPWPPRLARRLPFYYGWVVLACVCCAGFARQASSVAVLSIFVAPMTAEFGWSRTAISGAVSLGGILAAVASPFLGPVLDRRGARTVLGLAILSTAAS